MNQVLPRHRTPPAAVCHRRDVRLILILHAHGVAIERRVPARREVEHELVAVVEEPAAVDGLVVPDREVVDEPGPRPGQPLLDRDRLDPVNGVLQAEMAAGRLRHVQRRPGVGRLGPDVQEERPLRRQGAGRRGQPPICPLEILRPGDGVVVGAVTDAQVVGRRRDDGVEAAGLETRQQFRAVAEIEPEGGRAGRDCGVWTKRARHRPDCSAVRGGARGAATTRAFRARRSPERSHGPPSPCDCGGARVTRRCCPSPRRRSTRVRWPDRDTGQ